MFLKAKEGEGESRERLVPLLKTEPRPRGPRGPGAGLVVLRAIYIADLWLVPFKFWQAITTSILKQKKATVDRQTGRQTDR